MMAHLDNKNQKKSTFMELFFNKKTEPTANNLDLQKVLKEKKALLNSVRAENNQLVAKSWEMGLNYASMTKEEIKELSNFQDSIEAKGFGKKIEELTKEINQLELKLYGKKLTGSESPVLDDEPLSPSSPFS
jgi:hypothetical protein